MRILLFLGILLLSPVGADSDLSSWLLVHTEGAGTLRVSLSGTGNRFAASLHDYVDGEFAGSLQCSGIPNDAGLTVFGPAALDATPSLPFSELPFACSLTFEGGSHDVYVIAGGDITSISYEFPPNAEIIASGDTVLYGEYRDFEQAIGAMAGGPATANAGMGRTEPLTFHHGVVGRFGDSQLSPTMELRVQGPVEKLCPCRFDPHDDGPGTYSFAWTGAAVSFPRGPIVLIADAPPLS